MTTRRKLIYGGLALVAFGATVLAAMLFPTHEILAAFSGNFALAALAGALFQLMRDEAVHQKELAV